MHHDCHPSRRRNDFSMNSSWCCGAGDLLFNACEEKQIPRAAPQISEGYLGFVAARGMTVIQSSDLIENSYDV